MGNSILIGTGIFTIAMVLLGLKRGMIKMTFSLLSIVAIVVLIHILTPPAKAIIQETSAFKSVETKVETYVDKHIEKMTVDMTMTGTKSQEAIIDGLLMPNSVKEDLKKNNQNYGDKKVKSLNEYITNYLCDLILDASTFIILFVLLSILFTILIRVLNIMGKLPVISGFNTVGGAVVGLVEAVAVLWILCVIVTAFSTTGWGQKVCEAIADNAVLSFIYDNNPLSL
ncbi:MAG: CvpA family protein [Eubacterium sp.]|nr:CvpA family protein [Eubacterium sp.]